MFLVYVRLLSPECLHAPLVIASGGAGSASGAAVPASLGQQLYDNWVVDVPKLMDIAALYGNANLPRCRRLVAAVFDCEERYSGDLAEVIAATVHVVSDIVARASECGADAPAVRDDVPPATPLSTEDWRAIAVYLVDISSTIAAFLDVYPDACYVGMATSACLAVVPRACLFFPPLRRRECAHGDVPVNAGTTQMVSVVQSSSKLAGWCRL